MQGTLAVEPVDADFFDIGAVSITVQLMEVDGPFVYNFTGNFVWVEQC